MRLPAQARVQPVRVQPDPRLERALRQSIAIGTLLVLLLPAARSYNPWFGALPLWLLAMPLVSWWALHRFRLPRAPQALPGTRRRRRGSAQAHRRQVRGRPAFARAASLRARETLC